MCILAMQASWLSEPALYLGPCPTYMVAAQVDSNARWPSSAKCRVLRDNAIEANLFAHRICLEAEAVGPHKLPRRVVEFDKDDWLTRVSTVTFTSAATTWATALIH